MKKVVLTNPDQLETELEDVGLADKMDVFFDKVASQCQILTLRDGETIYTNIDYCTENAVHILTASFNKVEGEDEKEEDEEAITIRFNNLLPVLMR